MLGLVSNESKFSKPYSEVFSIKKENDQTNNYQIKTGYNGSKTKEGNSLFSLN